MKHSTSEGTENSRDMRESQRALELRKFFAPKQPNNAAVENAFTDSLNNDGALDAYAESIVWRLRGTRAMVSLIDRGTQYFLAGVVRTGQVDSDEEVITTGEWFGCQSVPTPGGLCENTLALDFSKEEYPCFIINDLSRDPRFASLPVVDGQIACYRFYAGTPITTSHGIKIGSLFFFDDKSRDGLSRSSRRFMHLQARNVMKHLETKREAAERRRLACMSKGIANFLERSSLEHYISSDESHNRDGETPSEGREVGQKQEETQAGLEPSHEKPSTEKETVLDKIRATLDHAADILRESLELTSGGVVFLDPAIGSIENDNTSAYADSTIDLGTQAERTYREGKIRQVSDANQLRPSLSQDSHPGGRHLSVGAIRSSTDKHKASKILAVSFGRSQITKSQLPTLDSKTLQSLINSYPQGNVWYMDDEGYFSSLEQITEWEQRNGASHPERAQSTSPINMTKKRAEAEILSRVFPGARQIIFLPLWDASGDRYYAGCFVWSESAVPVFTADSEIAYLSAFTNSLMVEISRLDALTSNKMKSDFISSISRMIRWKSKSESLQLTLADEFRSPLHGILASAEFLRESQLDSSQMEFISTIQNCSRTLLDTINHVLDYSKINSFERAGHHQDTISNELYQNTNVALVCEDIVNGMIAANEFRGTGSPDAPRSISSELLSRNHQHSHDLHHHPLEVIVDIEKRDWDFKVQPGALRRVVMNVFGNAQKYTESGYIMLKLRVVGNKEWEKHSHCVSLRIIDTGKGMSSDYMERKLYRPFAQEDPFATGVGLGLSIVWSIVNQLGGKISIRSELGKGTDVEVTIPVEQSKNDELLNGITNDFPNVNSDSGECIKSLPQRVAGKIITFTRGNAPSSHAKDMAWSWIQKYCTEWFGFQNKDTTADLIITDQENTTTKYLDGQRILIIHDDMSCAAKQEGKHYRQAIGKICTPIGPFKLARSILALFDQEIIIPEEMQKGARQIDVGTQTPLASPEERTVMNGIVLTDYGFTPSIPSMSDAFNINEAKQTRTTATSAWNNQQQSAANHVFASLSALSINPTPLQLSSTDTPSPTLPFFPQPKMTLTLPQPKNLTAPPSATTTPLSKGLHILAVDDNALNLQLLHRYLLKRVGDTIVTARNGLEAVEAVKSLPKGDGFDVIFMDSMPEMDGFEATCLIRSYESSQSVEMDEEIDGRGVSPPNEKKNDMENGVRKMERSYIVALTGLASRRDRNLAEKCGFDDFLTKPISFKKIGGLLVGISGVVTG